MYDVVTVGDIVIDLFFKGDSLTFKDDRFQLAIGGKYFVDQFNDSLGGGGANVAVGCSHFGLNTAVCGKVGDNVFKQIIIQKLVKKNVSTEFLLYEKNHLNISSIYLTPKGERTIVNYQTPNPDFLINEPFMDHMIQTKAFYMGNLPEISIKDKIVLMKQFKDKKVLTILNMGVNDCRKGKEELEKILEITDILIVNKHEFADIIKKDCEKLDLKEDMAKSINFKEKILVITDSSNGSYCYSQGSVYHQIALEPKEIVDTTGAGDAYTSGFISSYLQDANIELAIKQGAEFANEILGKIGAQ